MVAKLLGQRGRTIQAVATGTLQALQTLHASRNCSWHMQLIRTFHYNPLLKINRLDGWMLMAVTWFCILTLWWCFRNSKLQCSRTGLPVQRTCDVWRSPSPPVPIWTMPWMRPAILRWPKRLTLTIIMNHVFCIPHIYIYIYIYLYIYIIYYYIILCYTL